MTEPFRIQPAGAVNLYKTYALKAPHASHWEPCSCEDVDCPAMEFGWRTVVDETSDLGQMQAHYVRADSGRSYVESRDELGMTVFTFAAGQRCFAEHQRRLEREPLYLVRGGDWRANTGLIRRHVSGEDFVDDFANHQDMVADRMTRG